MSVLKGKVVIITGASSGIGEGISYHLASCGSKLSLLARNKEKLEMVVEKCTKQGLSKENIIYTVGDITQDDVRKKLIENTVTAFGSIDVLVNNAGIVKVAPVSEMEDDDFRRVVDVNQTAPFLLTKLAIPHLKKSKGGNILNISSINGHSTPVVGYSAYSMTKAAVNMFTKYLAIELAPFGIRVNTISPGVVKTNVLEALIPDEQKRNDMYDMAVTGIPLGQLGTPKDIAEVVAFLVSAKWITGENIVVDGGSQLAIKVPDIE